MIIRGGEKRKSKMGKGKVKWEKENETETYHGEIVYAVVSPFSQFRDSGEYKLKLKISKNIFIFRNGEKDRLKRFAEIVEKFNCLNEDEMADVILSSLKVALEK
jgi:hypothetical protein